MRRLALNDQVVLLYVLVSLERARRVGLRSPVFVRNSSNWNLAVCFAQVLQPSQVCGHSGLMALHCLQSLWFEPDLVFVYLVVDLFGEIQILAAQLPFLRRNSLDQGQVVVQ